MVDNIIKHAIVTGASRGVGRETVKKLAENNYKVIAVSRNVDAMKDLKSDFVDIYQMDICDQDQIERFFQTYKDMTLDLLVHNAGGGASPTEIIKETMDGFRRAYDINVTGPMYISQLFVPCLQKSKSPTIVFVTSMSGKKPFFGGGNYTNAKRGEMALVDTMRLEFPEYGIKVTEICPGSIDTGPKEKQSAISPEDVAETIRWIGTMPATVNINHIEISHIFNHRFG